jgi:hypothetical protein
MSEIIGRVAQEADNLRGDRTDRLFYEEFGSDPISVKKWVQGDALVAPGGNKIGTKIAWGNNYIFVRKCCWLVARLSVNCWEALDGNQQSVK